MRRLFPATTVIWRTDLILRRSRHRDVVEHRRGVPVGVQVVVGFWERTRRCPELLQQGGEVVGVSGNSRIELGNRDASDLHLFPSFRLVCLEDFVERLY